jgi:hypothetical protein
VLAEHRVALEHRRHLGVAEYGPDVDGRVEVGEALRVLTPLAISLRRSMAITLTMSQ